MSPVQPVRAADVYALTQDRSTQYREAAKMLGLTQREYKEFREALSDGDVDYVILPRHIDAMAGVHHRNGRVYVLRNVLVPSGSMGWRVALTDGTTVLVPRACANLSMNNTRRIASQLAPHKQARTRLSPLAATHSTLANPAVAVSFATPASSTTTWESSAADGPTSSSVTANSASAPTSNATGAAANGSGTTAPLAAAPALAAAAGHTILPFLAPLIPLIYGLAHGSPSSIVAPCSAGSNVMGVCHP